MNAICESQASSARNSGLRFATACVPPHLGYVLCSDAASGDRLPPPTTVLALKQSLGSPSLMLNWSKSPLVGFPKKPSLLYLLPITASP